MLRSFLIYLSKAKWAQKIVTSWGFAWRAASRFVSGNTIADAIRAAAELNAKGMNVTMDHLGEATETREDAVKAADDILELFDHIHASGVHANVSVKLTQIGLALDESLCEQNLEQILTRARQYQNFVRIDMEDTPYTDKTIRQYRLQVNTGVLIVQVGSGSPADKAGLKAGDVIVSIGGKNVTAVEDFSQILYAAQIGTPLTLGIWRGSSQLSVSVTPIASPPPG